MVYRHLLYPTGPFDGIIDVSVDELDDSPGSIIIRANLLVCRW